MMLRSTISTFMVMMGLLGCGATPPEEMQPCKGLINVTLEVDGSANPLMDINQYKALEVTTFAPGGARWVQTEVPPLVKPAVAAKSQGEFAAGRYEVRVVAAATQASTATAANPVEIKYIGRAEVQWTAGCAETRVKLATVTRTDICLDLCDYESRCGKAGADTRTACEAECRGNSDIFTAQEQEWILSWASFYRDQDMTLSEAAAKDKAKGKVQSLMGQFNSCNFAACEAVEDCGGKLLEQISTPQ